MNSSPSACTNTTIMIEDNKKVTLKPRNKRLGSWWDSAEEYNELSSIFKVVPEPKEDSDVASRLYSSLSSLSSADAIINIEDDEEETLESNKKKPRLGYDDSSVVKGSPMAKHNDAASRVDTCFSSTGIHEKKKNNERSVSSHHDIIDLCEDESVGDSTTGNNNKGYRHLTLEDLGVSVEDLKSIPWEAFDPTWEIRSVAMDPWLGGYVEDMLSPC